MIPPRFTDLRPRMAAIALPFILIAAPLATATHAASTRVHAIIAGRIVTAPGQTIEHGTIVMRDGVITAVGRGVAIPADARVWHEESLTVYPGLIDAEVAGPDAGAPSAPAAFGGHGSPAQAAARG